MTTFEQPAAAMSFSDMMMDEDSLDEYLRTLGPVQRTPTPPQEEFRSSHYTNQPQSADQYIYQDRRMLRGIAKKLTLMNSHASASPPLRLATTLDILDAIQPSLSTIALAYNVLANYRHAPQHKRQDSAAPMVDLCLDGEVQEPPKGELILLAVLRLASSFLEERQMALSEWCDAVDDEMKEEELSNATSEVFAAVGWKLPVFASPQAIGSALASLPVKGLVSRHVLPPLELDIEPINLLAPPERRKSSLVDPVSPYTLVQGSYFG